MNKECHVVVNLNSGTAKKKYEDIKAQLKGAVVHLVKNPENFSSVYDKVLKAKPKMVILGGGDGTLIRGIEYLDKAGFKGNFGLLPMGTANYLVRNLGIPLDMEDAFEVIKKGKTKMVPVSSVNGEYFALMMNIGLTRMLSEKISDNLKQNLGQFAYLIELIRQSKNSAPFDYEISSPDLKKTLRGKSRQLIIYNSDLNQQIKLVPDHELRKPTVKLVVTRTGRHVWRLYLALLIHVLTFGKIRKYISVYELSKLKIVTTPAEKADLDGEVSGFCPFNISAVATKIPIYQ